MKILGIKLFVFFMALTHFECKCLKKNHMLPSKASSNYNHERGLSHRACTNYVI